MLGLPELKEDLEVHSNHLRCCQEMRLIVRDGIVILSIWPLEETDLMSLIQVLFSLLIG